MPSTYTNSLRIEQPATGEQTNNWGQTLDTGLALIDAAIAGVTAISTSGGTTTLTALSGQSDQSRAAILLVSGTLASNATIVIPNTPKVYFVRNTLTAGGSYGLTISVAGSGATLNLYLAGGVVVFDGTTLATPSPARLFQQLTTGESDPVAGAVQGTSLTAGTVKINAQAGQTPLYLGLTGASTGAVFASFQSGPATVSGTITLTSGGVAYNTTSDYRAKTDLRPLDRASARLKRLRVYRGRMRGVRRLMDMFLAHEVAEVVPAAVTGRKDAVDRRTGEPVFQQLDHSRLVPLLTAALQEVIERLEALEQR